MRRSRLLVAALFVAVLLGVLWWMDEAMSGRATSARTAAGGLGSITTYEASDRLTTDPFEGILLSGEGFDSRELVGSVVVYNAWGSWCPPCRLEAADLARLAQETEGDVVFVGINVRDNEAAARAFEKRYKVPYDSLAPGSSDEAFVALRSAITPVGIPSTVVLDRNGNVAARVIGQVSYATLKPLVEAVVAEGSS